MIEIFKCQTDLFDKHGNISKRLEKVSWGALYGIK
jgi:hypothetical protein